MGERLAVVHLVAECAGREEAGVDEEQDEITTTPVEAVRGAEHLARRGQVDERLLDQAAGDACGGPLVPTRDPHQHDVDAIGSRPLRCRIGP